MGLFFSEPKPAGGPPLRMWENVYESARDSYERTIDGYDEEDSRLTANAAVRGWYRGSRLTPPVGLRACPDPQPNVHSLAPLNLGIFLEIHYVDQAGKIEGRSFSEADKVALLWSQSLRACFIYPYIKPGACARLPTPAENRLARVWAKGRPAKCVRPVEFPAPALPSAYPGIAITYYSDKFPNEHGVRTWQRYIHHFETGVVCYFARSSGATAPTAIMVRGGRLRLESHGLTG